MADHRAKRATAAGKSRRSVRRFTGLIRRFPDGLYGAVCFEVGVVTMAPTAQDAMDQMTELLDSEHRRRGRGAPGIGPITPEALAEFMGCREPAVTEVLAATPLAVGPKTTVQPFALAASR